jgi:tetratricopeptide (TPR) repeat protein
MASFMRSSRFAARLARGTGLVNRSGAPHNAPMDLYQEALAAHQRGDLGTAERLYLQMLQAEPRAFAPCHLLGVVRAQQGRHAEALELIDGALALQPDVPDALLNRGNVLKLLGRLDEALASYDRVLALRPDFADAHFNRGNALRQMKRPGAALQAYDRVLALRPGHDGALVNRGNALHEMKREAEALASFDQALARSPNTAETWKNRGITLRVLKRFPEALESFDRALALQPGSSELIGYRGHVLCESDRVAEGFALFREAAAVAIGQGAPPDPGAPPHKQKHDTEQQAWLGSRARVEGPLFLDGGGRIAGPAINPANADAVNHRWRNSNPQMVVIDNLLTPTALSELRRFCLGSNVWRQVYPTGYLGAFPEAGFAAPLLAQIADEFAQTYPAIFAGHPLRYLWAFKYDSAMRGIQLHADEAAVNVNFWITPDEANLDPDHGGLVVWDKAAPLDWDFDQYNGELELPRRFLKEAGATSVTVPYRANRAVIFDSDLFHETDILRFQDGYENRRINVTLLYGRREQG